MKIAIIGGGISGMGAAYLLAPHHEITLYEKNNRIGGHSRTVNFHDGEKDIPVDTGFIVFNHRNYPNLNGLFKILNVPTAKSDMSFGVSINNGEFEYGTRNPACVFAQKSNLLRPRFWKMLADILKFNRNARAYLACDESVSIGQCLRELKLGKMFRDYYLLPTGAAIWSASVEQIFSFPAKSFIRFFDNHGLLTLNDHPQWYTVVGGSVEYVKRLTHSFQDRIRLNCGVRSVRREQSGGVCITDDAGGEARYDDVIFACHSDQALNMIADLTDTERKILSDIAYRPNRAILHCDEQFMPKRKAARSSWVYLSESEKDRSQGISLTYWMNNLQPLPTKKQIFVTLNPHKTVDPALTQDEYQFEHPVFDESAIRAQNALPTIQGKDRYHFCGAWTRYGFHEDGLASAVRVAEQMKAPIPWK